MKNLNKTVHQFLLQLPHAKGSHIQIGFSGGADSTALIHVLSEKKAYWNLTLSAVFFCHGNSPIAVDEDKMFDFCTGVCKELGISLIKVDLDMTDNDGKGWENAGRQQRLQHYKETTANYVFLGHHKDDQNETTMTQLFRGGGKGVSGMKSIEGKYCRPFLDVHKSDIYAYLINNKHVWFEDPTNTNTDFTRNFWRNDVLPSIAKHYPNYSIILDNVRQKNQELHDIAYEMALNDGLDLLMAKQNIDITNLNNLRLKNLIMHYGQSCNVNLEKNFVEHHIAHYRANNDVIIQKGDLTIQINNNTMFSGLKKKNTLRY